jgi:hypothetical protein
MRPAPLFAAAFLLVTAGRLAADELAADGGVDYARQVKPLLAARCYSCHSPLNHQSDLRLDTAALAVQGGARGAAIVPGDGQGSLLIQALRGTADTGRMPPEDEGPPLAEEEIALLQAWIDQGAIYPADETPLDDPRRHWAFGPIVAPVVPGGDDGPIANPIDAFIIARLAQANLRPAAQADRATLARRVYLDLIGLPPTPKQVAAFVDDASPDAYERLVDGLLASPHYGERWGRHWLDAARYADSGGFESDLPRAMWMYRDWVIDALNADMPFDQFVVEQLAGDLLPRATSEQRVATGFLLCGPQDGGSEPSRVDALVERVSAVGSVFLGMTIGCAQCHQHKFEPISQQDYYRLFAFLNDADEQTLERAEPDQLAERDALRAQVAALEKERDEHLMTLTVRLPDWEATLTAEERAQMTEDVRSLLTVATSQRTPNQQNRVLAAVAALRDPGAQRRTRTINELKSRMPVFPSTQVLAAVSAPRQTHVLIRGELANPGAVVEPGVPAVLPPLESARMGSESAGSKSAGSENAGRASRLELARWLTSAEQPLTPRVTVNRAWLRLFGQGLVETEDDFGLRGARPSHPELLDWLAARFVADGWSIKRLIRHIVTSATYRQSSARRPEHDAIDPQNRLLARQNRRRLEAEIIRDVALAASGLLSPRVGGPSVFPYQPTGVLVNRATPAEWIESTAGDQHRRTLYTQFFRLTPHPFLPLFDAPDSLTACTRRPATNTPLQALTLLNDPTFVECARALAHHAVDRATNDRARLDLAFRRTLARSPTDEEQGILLELLAETRASLVADVAAAREMVGTSPIGASTVARPATDDEVVGLAAWMEVCRALLNLDEFITRE